VDSKNFTCAILSRHLCSSWAFFISKYWGALAWLPDKKNLCDTSSTPYLWICILYQMLKFNLDMWCRSFILMHSHLPDGDIWSLSIVVGLINNFILTLTDKVQTGSIKVVIKTTCSAPAFWPWDVDVFLLILWRRFKHAVVLRVLIMAIMQFSTLSHLQALLLT